MGACKSKAAKPAREGEAADSPSDAAEANASQSSPESPTAEAPALVSNSGDSQPAVKSSTRLRGASCSTAFSSSSSFAQSADCDPAEKGKRGPQAQTPANAEEPSSGVETVGDVRRRRLTVLGVPETETEKADSAAGAPASLSERFKNPDAEKATRFSASRSTISERLPDASAQSPSTVHTPGVSVNGPAREVEKAKHEEPVSLSALVRQGSFARSLHSSPPASVDGRSLILKDDEKDKSGRGDKGEGRVSDADEAELIQQIRREKSLPVAVEGDDPVAAKALSLSREQPVVAPSEADDASVFSGPEGTRSDSGQAASAQLVPAPRGPLPVSREDVWRHPELLTASLFLDLFTPARDSPACCFLGAEAHSRQESFDDKFEDVAIRPPGSNVLAIKKNLGFAYACKKGLKPDSPNQDDFGVLCCNAFRLFGVFDGHGPSGHDISGYVHRMLFALLLSDETLSRNPQLALRNAFVATHQSVLAYAAHTELFDCSLSGSTASVVLHTHRRLFVAHVGDSRVVLARQKKDGIVAEALTVDHKPTTPAERARIEAAGGELKRLECDIPYRVFLKGRLYPGLAMSRALGDAIANHVGVSCEPDVSTVELDRSCLFVIIASDGVWEFISNQEAVNIASEAMGAERKARTKAAADRLTLEAFKRWVEEEGNVVDDITCQVIWLR
uniref:Probable protein phosphatase 2C 64 n=1 Tax=Neospora caninum (strain Liverpool) TaxID=572307 RepID=A0A0F7U9H2_NEOCL|nr:TPA: Probable protein phosphatase 2C 64 [Neospora caninum Liverpool]